MADQLAWKVDLNKLSHEVARASQHTQQVLHAAVTLADLARAANENVIAALAEVEDTRGRGSVQAPSQTTRETLSSLDDALPKPGTGRVNLRRRASDLLQALPHVRSLEDLQQWYLEQLKIDRRRRRSIATYRQPGITVSGALFEPLNNDDSRDNGDALTLRIQTAEDGVLPVYVNLGSLILLALIGARAVSSIQPPSVDDEDWDDEDEGFIRGMDEG